MNEIWPEQRLAAAVLLRAVRDARGSDPNLAGEARRWLTCDGLALAEALDISPEQVTTWMDGLPELAFEQLRFLEGG